MAEPERLDLSKSKGVHVLSVSAGGRVVGVPAGLVREIVLPSALTKVPLSPRALLGLANLRGRVMPVLSLAILLNQAGLERSEKTRVVVLDGQAPVGLLVEEIHALEEVTDAAPGDQGLLGEEDADIGAFIPQSGMRPSAFWIFLR